MFLDEKRGGEARTEESFLRAATLGITDSERDVLIRSLYLLESGTIKDRGNAIYTGGPNFSDKPAMPTMFNMGSCSIETDCGTASCILGIGRAISGNWNFMNYSVGTTHSAYRLFFPTVAGAIHCTDPKKGARALRSYLEIGNPKWTEAMRS